MGCQKGITEAITDQGADYVLALKDNQGELRADTESIFERIRKRDRELPEDCKSVTGGHDLRTVCMVKYERIEEGEPAPERRSTERRYYVSSLDPDAETFLQAARRHWHIENRMHWVLDVAFQEDQSRIRAGHAAQNMATVRRLALSLLEQDDSLIGRRQKQASPSRTGSRLPPHCPSECLTRLPCRPSGMFAFK
jgi:predicted transposase YbfD/YdcC